MATRWIRWNTTTHIFEYSTDGVVFNALPLSAAILTEGTIDSARLPAGLPSLTANNIWTGVNRLSAANPALQLNETDQGVGLKNWDLNLETGILKLRKLDDAYASPTDLLSVDRDGKLRVANGISVINDITGSVATDIAFNVRNNNNGAASRAYVSVGNDATQSIGMLAAYASTFTTSGWAVAAGAAVISAGAGGLSLAASDAAGTLKFFTAGNTTARLTISAAGNASFSGDVAVTGDITANDATLSGLLDVTGNISSDGTITERNRSFAMGEWTSIAYSAPNFTSSSGTWTVDSGDQITYAYTLIGKTMHIMIDLQTTSVSAAMAELRVAVPTGATIAKSTSNSIYYTDNGTTGTGVVFATSGLTYLICRRFSTTLGNWNASTNNTSVRFQITIEIQ